MSESIRIVITETNNLVSVEETQIRVSVQEQTVVVNVGEPGGGGSVELVTEDDEGIVPAMGDSWGYALVDDSDTAAWQNVIDPALDGDITITVAASGGSDDPSADRPSRLRPGTYADGYATLAGALAAIPRTVKRAIVNLEAGNFDGAIVTGFHHGAVDLVGTWATPSLASGVTSGTAGAGSGATVLNKPAAAANWVAGALVGYLVRITGGGGYLGTDAFEENVLRIRSNTTTQIVLESSMYGLDATSQFEIVKEGTVLDTAAADEVSGVTTILGVVNCTADVRTRRIRIDNTGATALYGLVTQQTQYVDLVGLGLTNAIAVPGYSSNLRLLSVHLRNSYLYLYGQNVILLNGLVGEDSTLQVDRFQSFTGSNVWIDGDVGYWNAVHIAHGNVATLGGSIDNCLYGTPVVLENVHEFNVATSLAGTNAGVEHAFDISGGGQYTLSGATIAGSDAAAILLLEGDVENSYAQLSGNGAVGHKGTFVLWGTGSIVFPESVNVFSGQLYIYAFLRPLGNAYKEITAHAGGGQGSATTVGYIATKITVCATDHDSVRLLGSADISVTGGISGSVWNGTAKIADLYPPTGQRIYDAEGTDYGINGAIEIPAGRTLMWVLDNNGNYAVTLAGSGGGGSHELTATFGDANSTESVVAGGVAYVRVPYDGTIVRWDLVSDAVITCQLDVWKRAGALPTVAHTITASAKPALSNATVGTDSTLTGWTTSVVAGDVLAFKLNSVSGGSPTQITLTLQVE